MPTSVITNTITDPSGTAIPDIPIVARLMKQGGFRIDTSTEVAREERTTTNGSGTWSLTLEENSNITPDDTWWEIYEEIPSEYGGAHQWSIEVGANDSTLLAALTTPIASSGMANYLTQEAADARYLRSLGITLGYINVVTDFGANQAGTADASAAFIAALALADASRKVGNSGSVPSLGGSTNSSGGGVKVYVPPGFYRFDATVPVPDYVRLVMDGAVIFSTDTTVDLFSSVGYQAHFEGARFRGGRRHIYIETANVNSTVVNINDCHFDGNASGFGAIETDTNSASTLVNIDQFRYRNTTAGARFLKMGTGDKVTLSNGWMQGSNDYFIEITDGLLEMANVLGVPGVTGNAWIKTANTGSVHARGCRFGGEVGGKTVVECTTEPDLTASPFVTYIILENCQTYCSGEPVILFHDLPNLTIINGAPGIQSGAHLFEFSSSVPAASTAALGRNIRIFEGDGTEFSFPLDGDSGVGRSNAYSAHKIRHTSHQILGTADSSLVFLHGAAGSGRTVTNSATSNGTTTDRYGTGAKTVTVDDPLGDFAHYWDTGLNGLSTGVYTMMTTVTVTVAPANLIFYASNKQVVTCLPIGTHVISVPFYFDTGLSSSERVGLAGSNMVDGCVVQFTSVRVFAGAHEFTTPHAIAYGTAVPSTGPWCRGDRWMHTDFAAGEVEGGRCTASGTSGTWEDHAL